MMMEEYFVHNMRYEIDMLMIGYGCRDHLEKIGVTLIIGSVCATATERFRCWNPKLLIRKQDCK